MIPHSPTSLSDRSRLVGLLRDLSDYRVNSTDHNLAEQLGRLISVSDSIALARSLGQVSKLSKKSAPDKITNECTIKRAQDDILANRECLIKAIVSSFSGDTIGAGIQAPSPRLGTRPEALLTFEPYQRFYSMHQAQMAGDIHALRIRVRDDLATVSADLHQLAALDKILSESLGAHTAKLFSIIPTILQIRFTQLLKAHQQMPSNANAMDADLWLMPGGWLELFYQDMQALLLAELDLRIQPILGMLEALNEFNSKVSV